MSGVHKIRTPRGEVVQVTTPNGTVRAELRWNPGFGPEWASLFNDAQTWLDGTIVGDCDPYIPFKTGTLIKSGILGTVPGNGVVSWIAPYARRQYYMVRKTRSALKPLSGPRWFETAKTIHKDRWITGVQKMMAVRK